MNGKVSDGLTLTNYSAWVFIIGFDHNAEREGNGITFQGFKATKNGTPVCLTDSGYNSPKTSGTWFNMNNENTNVGGWQASLMRKNVMPLIKAAFPSDLKAVIKPSTIFTAPDTGDIALTATEDEVFLLAEYEVFGARRYASTQEPTYLKQYAYYSAGNSKVKYKHNATSNAVRWWERSPSSSDSVGFCSVGVNELSSIYSVDYSIGVAPCFKVCKPTISISASTTAKSGVTYTNGIQGISAEKKMSLYAEAISNNASITNGTSVVYIDDGKLHYKISVGDQVTLALNGTNYAFDVIGFNHDTLTTESAYGANTATGKAGITFQMHDLFATTYTMNSSDTNVGGWKSSDMRTSTMATMKGYLPDDWEAIIKPVNKVSGTGGGPTTETETVSDSCFLLSEIEIFGSITYSVPEEGTQYAYYKAGNSKVKYNSITGSPGDWWERSPHFKNSNGFCCVVRRGGAGNYTASNSYGVSFSFCV